MTTMPSVNDAFYEDAEEETKYQPSPNFNASNPDSFGVNWERLSYNGDTALHPISFSWICFLVFALMFC